MHAIQLVANVCASQATTDGAIPEYQLDTTSISHQVSSIILKYYAMHVAITSRHVIPIAIT